MGFLRGDIPLASPVTAVNKATDQPSLAMIKPAALSLLAAVLVCTPACEQQSYEETRMFNQKNSVGGHGHAAGGEAAAAHPAGAPATHAAEGAEKK